MCNAAQKIEVSGKQFCFESVSPHKKGKLKKRLCNDLNKLYFIMLKNEKQSGTSMFIALSPTEPQMEVATLNF